MRRPAVTVITPTRSRQEELVDCVASVSEQTYEGAIEHMILSDGSQFVRDNIDRLRQINPRLVVKDVDRKSMVGEVFPFYIPSILGRIRNFAVREASGEFVCYLDDDNRITPDHVESLVDAITSQADIDIAYSWRLLVYADGSPYLKEEYPWTPNARLAISREQLSKHIYDELVRLGIRIPGSNLVRDTVIAADGQPLFTVDQGEFLVKREVQLRLPFTVRYPWRKMVGDYSDDHDFIERAYHAGCKFKCTERATLLYTVGGCSQEN
jgi:glycosyltransferase involved in cell wall biosynthesis